MFSHVIFFESHLNKYTLAKQITHKNKHPLKTNDRFNDSDLFFFSKRYLFKAPLEIIAIRRIQSHLKDHISHVNQLGARISRAKNQYKHKNAEEKTIFSPPIENRQQSAS